VQAFPVAYIEFFDDGEQKRREGPRNETEETKLHEQWKVSAASLASDSFKTSIVVEKA
jgi:hypothetical protein